MAQVPQNAAFQPVQPQPMPQPQKSEPLATADAFHWVRAPAIAIPEMTSAKPVLEEGVLVVGGRCCCGETPVRSS